MRLCLRRWMRGRVRRLLPRLLRVVIALHRPLLPLPLQRRRKNRHKTDIIMIDSPTFANGWRRRLSREKAVPLVPALGPGGPQQPIPRPGGPRGHAYYAVCNSEVAPAWLGLCNSYSKFSLLVSHPISKFEQGDDLRHTTLPPRYCGWEVTLDCQKSDLTADYDK